MLGYLLAGKNADTKKINTADRRNVELINLRRLQKLLLGEQTIEEISQLDRLTKQSFKGNAYEAAAARTTATNNGDGLQRDQVGILVESQPKST